LWPGPMVYSRFLGSVLMWEATIRPMKTIWSPAGICESRVHSKLATASANNTESIAWAGSVLQSNSANLSMSQPDLEPKNKAASAMSADGKEIVKHFECVMASIE